MATKKTEARVTEQRTYMDKRVEASHAPELPALHVSRNVRSDIADEIEHYWVGKEHSANTGMQYLKLDRTAGVVRLDRYIERRDLLCLQHRDHANVFVEPRPDGSVRVQIDAWTDAQLTDAECDFYHSAALLAVEQNREYWERECRFFTEAPWKQVDGMSPSDAVAKLRELGW